MRHFLREAGELVLGLALVFVCACGLGFALIYPLYVWESGKWWK